MGPGASRLRDPASAKEGRVSLPRVSSIFLLVRDLKESVRFYRDALGFREGHGEEAFAILRLGEIELMLQAEGGDAAPSEGSKRGEGVVFCLEAADARRCASRLAEAGFPPLRGPVEQPWGRTELTVDDPDGYRWNLWQRTVGRRMWPSGGK
jgi:catechol 2,3-dioxygenase-like lactoylglutathione lyase family enzyme